MSATDLSPIQISFQPRRVKSQVEAKATKRARSRTRSLVAIITSLPVIATLVAVGAFLYVALTRVSYPYELEWLESGILEHTARLAHGHSLYTQPGFEFSQLPYAPFGFVLGSAVLAIVGDQFWALRAISILSIVGVCAVLYKMVKSETANSTAAITAVGVFGATYAVNGFFFDVAKPDSLFLFITIGAVALARSAATKRRAAVAALVMTLAILTKQTAVFVFAPIALYLLVTKPRIGLSYLITGLASLGIVTFVLNALTSGWYNFFVWELLFQHGIIEANKKLFFTHDMRPLIPGIVLVLASLPLVLKRERLWSTGFYSFAIAGMVAGAYSSRLHSGGAENVLMPAFASAALAIGIAYGVMLQRTKRVLITLFTTALVLTQFYQLRYEPNTQIPSTADRQASDQFVAWLKTVPGDVWIVDHPSYALAAGKPTFAGEGGIEDVMRGKSNKAKSALQTSIADAIHQQRFNAIVLDGPQDDRAFPADWKNYYEQMSGSAMPGDHGHPIVNNTGVPRDVWVPVGTTVVMPEQLFNRAS